MADSPERPIDARLRAFGNAAEELIPLNPAGAAAARSLATRRTRRRRACLAATISTVTVATAAWAFLPRNPAEIADVPPRTTYVATSSLLPPQKAEDELSHTSLVAPAALPWHNTYTWHTTEIGSGSEVPVFRIAGCELRKPGAEPPEAEVAASYSGHEEASAQHRIAAYRTEAQALAAFEALETALRSCGWHRAEPTVPSHGTPPDAVSDYTTSVGDSPHRATLVRVRERFALLIVSAGAHKAHP